MNSSSSPSGSLQSSFVAVSMQASGEDISKLLATLMDCNKRIFSVLFFFFFTKKNVLDVALKLCFSDLLDPFDCLILLQRFKVFCAINSASYGLCPLKDASGSDSPRQRIFSGIHRQCHKDKIRPPSFEKKKRGLSLATTAYGELSQFLFLYGKCGVFQVKPFVAYTTCDLGSCVARQTLWLFDISERWLTSFCHSHFFPSSLYPSID